MSISTQPKNLDPETSAGGEYSTAEFSDRLQKAYQNIVPNSSPRRYYREIEIFFAPNFCSKLEPTLILSLLTENYKKEDFPFGEASYPFLRKLTGVKSLCTVMKVNGTEVLVSFYKKSNPSPDSPPMLPTRIVLLPSIFVNQIKQILEISEPATLKLDSISREYKSEEALKAIQSDRDFSIPYWDIDVSFLAKLASTDGTLPSIFTEFKGATEDELKSLSRFLESIFESFIESKSIPSGTANNALDRSFEQFCPTSIEIPEFLQDLRDKFYGNIEA